MEVERMDR